MTSDINLGSLYKFLITYTTYMGDYRTRKLTDRTDVTQLLEATVRLLIGEIWKRTKITTRMEGLSERGGGHIYQ